MSTTPETFDDTPTQGERDQLQALITAAGNRILDLDQPFPPRIITYLLEDEDESVEMQRLEIQNVRRMRSEWTNAQGVLTRVSEKVAQAFGRYLGSTAIITFTQLDLLEGTATCDQSILWERIASAESDTVSDTRRSMRYLKLLPTTGSSGSPGSYWIQWYPSPILELSVSEQDPSPAPSGTRPRTMAL